MNFNLLRTNIKAIYWMEQTKSQGALFYFLSLAKLLFSSSVQASDYPGSLFDFPVGFLLTSIFGLLGECEK